MRVGQEVGVQANGASVAVLAGGQSRRMGEDKSFVDLAGRPLVARVIETVTALGLPVHIITNQPERYAVFGLPMYGDLFPGKGSLGGLYTALHHSGTAWTLCVACDMPFLNPALLRDLLAQATDGDAVVPRVDGRPQSLHAVYHRGCMGAMREALDRDELKIQRVFARLDVRYVDEARLTTFDPTLRSFMNVNTPDELARARAVVAGEGDSA